MVYIYVTLSVLWLTNLFEAVDVNMNDESEQAEGGGQSVLVEHSKGTHSESRAASN